jgi:hypothetical protein
MATMCPPVQTQAIKSQWSMDLTRTVKSWLDVLLKLTWLGSTQHPINSIKHPKRVFVDRTRPIACDLMHIGVWSKYLSTSHAKLADVSVHQLWPDTPPTRLVSDFVIVAKGDWTRRIQDLIISLRHCLRGLGLSNGCVRHLLTSVWSHPDAFFSFSKATTASPMLPTC